MNDLQNVNCGWDYDESVLRIKPRVFKMKNLTIEIVRELWIARQELDSRGLNHGKENVANATFSTYCIEIGISRMTAHRWLERYISEENLFLSSEEFKKWKKQIEIEDNRIIFEYKKTGVKPKGWVHKHDKMYKKFLDDDEYEKRMKEHYVFLLYSRF